jgi:hypothetical protein
MRRVIDYTVTLFLLAAVAFGLWQWNDYLASLTPEKRTVVVNGCVLGLLAGALLTGLAVALWEAVVYIVRRW